MPCRSACSAIHLISGKTAYIAGIGTDDMHGMALDQMLVVLAQVDLLTGVDRRYCRARHLAIDVVIDEGRVVAGDHVLDPH